MRYTIDTEFLENGRTIDLISLGLVAEDGEEYYAVNANIYPVFDQVQEHPWLAEHVVPKLPLVLLGEPYHRYELDLGHPTVFPHSTIAEQVRAFLLDRAGGQPVELWAACGGFDYVALSQLWGPMAAKPDGIPHLVHELEQRWEDCGRPALPTQNPSTQHHALGDAQHNWAMLHTLDLTWQNKSTRSL